eukprot:TRINITY_DN11525_c0_g2_i1.p2 TRINITY_DN11525_c0_g2~~TRINITY_DN11525_c0_g2_i1.p2  ORF type:complete len:357 (+),score=103.54 TRINITY_DN11525_c0_g2_i1:153-1223(+)
MNQNVNCMSLNQLENYIGMLRKSVITSKEINADLMNTFLINKQLLDVAFEKRCEIVSPKARSLGRELLQKLHKIEESNSELFQRRLALDEEVLECKNTLEDEQSAHRTEIDGLEGKNSALARMAAQREKQIKTLQSKASKNGRTNKEDSKGPKSFVDPTPQTIAMHNELQVNKAVFKKLNKKVENEYKKQKILNQFNKQLKERNAKLKKVLKDIVKGFENFPEKKSQVLKSMNIERIKKLLESEVEEPIILNDQDDRFKRADTTIPQRTFESEPISFAVCSKSMLTKPGMRVVPLLNLSEVNDQEEQKAGKMEFTENSVIKLKKKEVEESTKEGVKEKNSTDIDLIKKIKPVAAFQ